MAEGQTVQKNTAQKYMTGSLARHKGIGKRVGSSSRKIGRSKKSIGRGSTHGH